MEFLTKLQNLNPKQKIIAIIAGIIGLLCLVALIYISIQSSVSQTIEFDVLEHSDDINRGEDEKAKPEGNKIETFYIEVLGQVNNPGVYHLYKNIIILEALELAGGLTEDADLLYIHKILSLSELVVEHQKIYIPSIFENSVKVTGDEAGTDKNTRTSGDPLSLDGKININTASLENLVSLPGIGEVTAEKIISGRPYTSLEQLKDIQGIGESKYNSIVSLITL